MSSRVKKTELASITAAQLADSDVFDVVDVDDTSMSSVGTNKKLSVAEMKALADGRVAVHTATATDAHDASAISVLDTANNYTGTNVETVLAELPGRFGLVANPATGVAATDTAHVQALLATGADVKLRRSGTFYNFNAPLAVASHQEFDGDFAACSFSHAGALFTTSTPGVRSYGQQIRRLRIVGPGIGVAGSIAIDMDSMSLAHIEEVWIESAATGIRMWSAIPGGCVYNEAASVVISGCVVGVDVGLASNENRVTQISKIGGCTTAGVRITDANRTTISGTAFEVNEVGVQLVATSEDFCILNNLTDCRFEVNTVGVRVGSLVKDTRILENGFTGAGTYLEDRGQFTICDDRRVANANTPYGRRAALHFTGATGNFASTPDVAALDITGDLFLSAQLALTDWTPGASQIVIDKVTASNISYRLYVAGSGRIGLMWSANGTTLLVQESSVAPTIADGTWRHIAAYLDVNNGASGHTVTFYTSVDGQTWDVLGSPVVVAGITSVFAGTSPLFVGVSNDTVSSPLAGRIASATVRSGSATGAIAARFDADAMNGSNRLLDVAGKVWTMTGSAWCSTLY